MLSTFRLTTTCSLLALALGWTVPSEAAVLLQDSFENGDKAVPDSTTVGNWTNYSSAAVTESGGMLTVSTTSSGGSSSSNFSTPVNSAINPFTTQVNVAVREFSLFGTETYESASAGRFRLGLVSTLGSFYGTNDAFALEINSNGTGFRLGTKFDNTAGDPNGLTASASNLSSAITGFDLSVTDTTWALVLYSGLDVLYSDSGTWSLGDVDTWGSGTGNEGSSALLMAVQNSGGGSSATGNKSFSIGSIEITTGTSVVPEPSRMLLLSFALAATLFTRRRPLLKSELSA